MSDGQKFPVINALTNMMQQEIGSHAETVGQSLPCHVVAVSGQIVTVKFEMLPDGINYPEVTIPIATFPYIRYPIQPGDMGVTVAARVSLRGVSGLGTGTATRSLVSNLAPLFFVPLSNAGWTQEDPQKIVLYGPDGAILKTAAGDSSVTVEPGKVTTSTDEIYLNAKEIFLTAATIHLNGSIVQDAGQIANPAAKLIGPLTVEGDTISQGVSVSTHSHNVENVQGGSATITSQAPN